ncbi:MAG: tetratricopeptide repeat protein [Myxococcaceae bacterium]|nr:tetratricopeptide repeat protein [Myxococcaceae bacterium]
MVGGVLIVALCLAQADAPLRREVLLAQVSPRVPELDQATAQVEAGDFEEAVATLQRGLSQPELTDDQIAEMSRLLGLAHLYLGNEDKARDAFEKLLQARPDYELPKSTPPKIRALYARLKDDIKKRRVRPVTLTLVPPETVAQGKSLELAARIEDLSLGARPKLFFRRAGGQSYSSVDFVRVKGSRESFTATVPAYELPADKATWQLEYYVEVSDAAARRLAGRGDAYAPLSLPVVPELEGVDGAEKASPWYKNPLVWIGVGVGVAAVTTTAVVLATQKQTGTLPITIRIEGMP